MDKQKKKKTHGQKSKPPMKTPGLKNYYSALQEVFQLQSGVLTEALPHSGERGRNDEQRFREFLERILPKRFSVGSGFVVCSEQSVSISSQNDVVLFDEFQNAPIHRELASHVYPVEIVYGTVEVKGRVEKRDLLKICKDIVKLRKLGEHRYYIDYSGEPIRPDKPENKVVVQKENRDTVPPRAFIFAYEQRGWKTLSQFAKDLKAAVRKAPAHIHGFAILNSDWYVSQKAYAKPFPQFDLHEGAALLKFINGMLHSLGSVPIRQMSIDRYYKGSR